MRELAFIVYGDPQPRGSKTIGRGKHGGTFVRDSNPRSYAWMRDVAQVAGNTMRARPLLRGPLRVDVDFFLPRPKGHYGSGRNAEVVKASAPARPIVAPDKGKLERGTLDALEGIVYVNDAQVVEGDTRKFYGEPTRCEIQVYSIAGSPTDLPAELAGEQHASSSRSFA